MTKAMSNSRRFFKRWHKIIGLIVGLPMLVPVVTGLLLQFPQLLGPLLEVNTAITIDPLDPAHWIRGTNFGLHHSFDRGGSWMESPLMWSPGSIRKLVFASNEPNLVYALGAQALLVSHDSGRIWELLSLQLSQEAGWGEFLDISLGKNHQLLVRTEAGWAESNDKGLNWITQTAHSAEQDSRYSLIHDLHTGYWMGVAGPWAVTVTAAGTILLIVSGFLIVLNRRKNGAAKNG